MVEETVRETLAVEGVQQLPNALLTVHGSRLELALDAFANGRAHRAQQHEHEHNSNGHIEHGRSQHLAPRFRRFVMPASARDTARLRGALSIAESACRGIT